MYSSYKNEEQKLDTNKNQSRERRRRKRKKGAPDCRTTNVLEEKTRLDRRHRLCDRVEEDNNTAAWQVRSKRGRKLLGGPCETRVSANPSGSVVARHKRRRKASSNSSRPSPRTRSNWRERRANLRLASKGEDPPQDLESPVVNDDYHYDGDAVGDDDEEEEEGRLEGDWDAAIEDSSRDSNHTRNDDSTPPESYPAEIVPPIALSQAVVRGAVESRAGGDRNEEWLLSSKHIAWIGCGSIVFALSIAFIFVASLLLIPSETSPDMGVDLSSRTPSSVPSISPTFQSSTESLYKVATNKELKRSIFEHMVQVTQGVIPTRPPMADWDVSNITDLSEAFLAWGDNYHLRYYFNQDLSRWNVSGVTNMDRMFAFCENFTQDLSRWDTSRVTSMQGMFAHALNFNGNVRSWNVSKVTNAEAMFLTATSFHQDLSAWDVSRVETMYYMFKDAISFNGNVGTWKTRSVKSFQSMFENAIQLDQDLNEWDTSQAITMKAMFATATRGSDFWNAGLSDAQIEWVKRRGSRFNGAIGAWNTSRVVNLESMFGYALHFNQDIGQWDVSRVTSISFTFQGTVAFDQDLSRWNLASLEKFKAVFYEAEAFQHDVSAWNISRTVDASYAFAYTKSFGHSLCDWWDVLRGNQADATNMFLNATACPEQGSPNFTDIGNYYSKAMCQKCS